MEREQHSALLPCVVQCAEGYIEAHADTAISVADLVRVCGCSQSALFQAFQKARGYAPMQFLAEVRLRRARQRLLSGNSSTVSVVAFDAGFNHLGRSTKAYCKRFGKIPSETPKRYHHYGNPSKG